MNAIRNFAFEEHLVRVVERDGAPWFVGKDVCGALGLRNHNDALAGLDEDERGVATTDPLSVGGAQNVTIVSEPGVFRLVFRSRKAEAERFKRWLAHEVLPQIRRTGRYAPEAAAADAPEADNAPLAALRVKLDLVREARIQFGPARAALLWAELGLPAVPLVVAPPDDEPEECLRWLLDAAISGEGVEVLLVAALSGDLAAGDVLAASGLRVVDEFERRGFLVASSAPAARALFSGSRWHSGGYTRALRRLPGAALAGTLSFGGWPSRSTFVPASYLDG